MAAAWSFGPRHQEPRASAAARQESYSSSTASGREGRRAGKFKMKAQVAALSTTVDEHVSKIEELTAELDRCHFKLSQSIHRHAALVSASDAALGECLQQGTTLQLAQGVSSQVGSAIQHLVPASAYQLVFAPTAPGTGKPDMVSSDVVTGENAEHFNIFEADDSAWVTVADGADAAAGLELGLTSSSSATGCVSATASGPLEECHPETLPHTVECAQGGGAGSYTPQPIPSQCTLLKETAMGKADFNSQHLANTVGLLSSQEETENLNEATLGNADFNSHYLPNSHGRLSTLDSHTDEPASTEGLMIGLNSQHLVNKAGPLQSGRVVVSQCALNDSNSKDLAPLYESTMKIPLTSSMATLEETGNLNEETLGTADFNSQPPANTHEPLSTVAGHSDEHACTDNLTIVPENVNEFKSQHLANRKGARVLKGSSEEPFRTKDELGEADVNSQHLANTVGLLPAQEETENMNEATLGKSDFNSQHLANSHGLLSTLAGQSEDLASTQHLANKPARTVPCLLTTALNLVIAQEFMKELMMLPSCSARLTPWLRVSWHLAGNLRNRSKLCCGNFGRSLLFSMSTTLGISSFYTASLTQQTLSSLRHSSTMSILCHWRTIVGVDESVVTDL